MAYLHNFAAVSLTAVIILIVLIAILFRAKIKALLASDNNSASETYPNNVQVTEGNNIEQENLEISSGELRLIGVDERTAAIIMATVCDHLNTPLNELQFKSIKALD